MSQKDLSTTLRRLPTQDLFRVRTVVVTALEDLDDLMAHRGQWRGD